MEEMQLQKWISSQIVDDEMLWKGSWGRQVEFFRDSVAGLFGMGLHYDEREDIASVISTHRSKSIILPVYKLHRPDIGLTLIARNNFYNWKLSVISEREVEANFDGLFHTTPPLEPDYTGNPLHPVYFEGFPGEYIFSYYATSDKKKFSAEIGGGYTLWTVVFLLLRSLGVVKADTWHTRESHRAELDADSARRKQKEAKRESVVT